MVLTKAALNVEIPYIYRVKLLSFFLALLVLVLTCMPCSDATASNCAPVNSPCTLPSCPDQHQDSGDTHEDLCSPFCQCACCAVACTLPAMLAPLPENILILSEKPVAACISGNPVHMALPVWQPPQSN